MDTTNIEERKVKWVDDFLFTRISFKYNCNEKIRHTNGTDRQS